MAKTDSASIVTLHQPRPLTGAERTRNYRLRKKAEAVTVTSPTPIVTLPRRSPASLLLTVAGFGMTATGICMNGYFSGSQGSSAASGWMFLAIGVAADLVACAMPECSARHWAAGRRMTSLTGWAVWTAIFIFVLMNGIGFTGVNLADVTLARQGRVTPAVTSAQTALDDARAARDRECKGGVGKFCREREAAVVERQTALDAARKTVAQTIDPQIDATTHVVAWASRGVFTPSNDDAASLRLLLLALLPQIGGLLLMLGREK